MLEIAQLKGIFSSLSVYLIDLRFGIGIFLSGTANSFDSFAEPSDWTVVNLL